MKFKYLGISAITLFAVVLLTGCGEKPKPPEPSSSAGGLTPEQIKWNQIIMCQRAAFANSQQVKCETQ
jgi:hypothetical protein